MRFMEPAVFVADDMLAGSYVREAVFKVQGRGELRASRPEETLPKQVMFFGDLLVKWSLACRMQFNR